MKDGYKNLKRNSQNSLMTRKAQKTKIKTSINGIYKIRCENIWRSDFHHKVSAKNRVQILQDIYLNQIKPKVNDTC